MSDQGEVVGVGLRWGGRAGLLMSATRNNENVMPFANISNFEMALEIGSVRTAMQNKLANNGFNEFLRDYHKDLNLNTNVLDVNGQYFDIDELNNTANKKSNVACSMIHMNIRRISKNKGKLLALLSVIDMKFDIIILSEIGHDGNNYINDNYFPGYDFYIDLPINNKYGGVAVMIKRDYGSVTQRDDLKIPKTCQCDKCAHENIWLEVNTGQLSFIKGAVYRHPNGAVNHFTNDLDTCFSKIPPNRTCFFVGDTNIDLMKYEHNTSFDYFTSLSSSNVVPYISTPTHITDTSATLIDHIFVKLSSKHRNAAISTGNLISDITDHLPNFLIWEKTPCPNTNNRPLTRLFSENNITKFRQHLDSVDWNQILNGGDMDTSSGAFYNEINRAFNKCFPLVRLSKKRSKDKKWITKGIKICVRKKNILYKEQLKNPLEKNMIEYKNYKNVLNRCLKEAEDSHYLEKISDKQNGIINFWKSFGKTINNKKNKSNLRLQKLIVNGEEITDDVEIANELNNYFCEIGEKLSSNIKPTGIDFTSYLKKKINETFFLAPVMEQEVRRELSTLNHKKSPGPDNIPAKLIKECATQFSTPLTLLYNKSIMLAKYPGQWKLARVTALYKKKNRSLPENYRPICLLNIFEKVFEKLVYIQMMNFIDKHKILFIYQYGFRKKHSTSLALIDIVDKIKFALDKNDYALGILLDITKAFDSINHGLTLDENLSWDAHIDDVCNNLVKYFSIFYNIRNVVTSHVARAIYFACIHSRIKYGTETYGSASEYKISKLQIL